MSREDWAFTPTDFIRYLQEVEGLPSSTTRLPPRAIMVFGSSDFEVVRRALRARRTRWNPGVAVGRAGRRSAAVIKSTIGAPAAGITLEESIALGLRAVLTFGACGSLSSRLPIGSVILPTRAYADEGTSRHYGRSRWTSPSADVVRGLRSACRKQGLGVSEGAVWTIDAPYRESLREARSLASRGVMAVEMEASALYAIARTRRIQAGSLFVVSDELGAEKWNPGFSDPRFLRAKRRAVRGLVDALSRDWP